MKNPYLLSINETSRIYGAPRDKLRRAAKNNELPVFVKIGGCTKVNTKLFEQLIDEKAQNGEALFK